MIFKIDSDKFVKVDDTLSKAAIVVKSDVCARLDDIKKQIESCQLPTDKALLAWAKENYPMSQDYKELVALKDEARELESLLESLV